MSDESKESAIESNKHEQLTVAVTVTDQEIALGAKPNSDSNLKIELELKSNIDIELNSNANISNPDVSVEEENNSNKVETEKEKTSVDNGDTINGETVDATDDTTDIVDENTIGDTTATTATTTTTYRELTMDEIDDLIKNREVKVSTVLPNVPQTSGKRLRMIIIPQKEYDNLIGECTGLKYGSYERPEYHFHVIGSKENTTFPYPPPKVEIENIEEQIVENVIEINKKDLKNKEHKKKKKEKKEKKHNSSSSSSSSSSSVSSSDGASHGIDFENDEITILFDKSVCLYVLSPQTVDALFLRLRHIPTPPTNNRGEITYTGLVIRRGYWHNDDKIFVECNREVVD